MISYRSSRRVGRTINVDDEKLGCTVTVSAELLSSRLLPCQIIMTGVFGANLSEAFAAHQPSLVLFNPTHWQNSMTFCMYLRYVINLSPGTYIFLVNRTTFRFFRFLLGLFPRQRVGVISDRCRQHYGSVIEKFVESLNADPTIPGEIATDEHYASL